MPEQKGKRRKPQRRGTRPASGPAYTEPAPQPEERTAGSSRIRRRAGWNAPLWVNVPVGILMLIAGVYFGLLQPGAITTARVVLLVAYIAIGIWYLYRASLQLRARM